MDAYRFEVARPKCYNFFPFQRMTPLIIVVICYLTICNDLITLEVADRSGFQIFFLQYRFTLSALPFGGLLIGLHISRISCPN